MIRRNCLRDSGTSPSATCIARHIHSSDVPAYSSGISACATVGLKVQENSRCENVSSSVSSSRFYQTILPLLFFQQRKALILGSTRSTCCRL